MSDIRFGLAFANSGALAAPDMASLLATTCEEVGIDSVWTVEHPALPVSYDSPYPYTRDGKMPGGGSLDVPDPFVWLSFLAARTTRLRLATGICILPLRHPLMTAKEVATLDLLSGGRVILGIGVGWLSEEFEALGVPWAERGRRTDEYIDAIRAVWAGDNGFDGTFTSFEPIVSLPRPARPVPIVVGGHSDAAARRAGSRGDGFYPAKGNRARLAELIDIMRRSADAAGRDPDAIELVTTVRDHEVMAELIAMGFTTFLTSPPAFDAEGLRSGLYRFADEVISRY